MEAAASGTASLPYPAPGAASVARTRLGAALASAMVLAGLITGLVIGLRPPPADRRPTALATITLAPATPRPEPTPARIPPVHRPDRPPAPREAPAPPAARSQALPAAAPPPPVVLVVPAIPAARLAGAGAEADNGAAAAGPGSGAGGAGAGRGGGGTGGAGTGAAPAIRARQLRGHLSPRDVPDGLIPAGGSVTVGVRFTVTPAGRASACRVIRSSGTAAIDALPCPLLEARYRFRPARDRTGQPTSEIIEETHTWFEPDQQRDP